MQAELSIRKSKQILAYEYEVEVEWMAENETDECNGSFKVSDINAEEMDFEISSIKADGDATVADKSKRLLKKGILKDELVKLFKPIREEIMSMEADHKKLEEDRMKREEAAKLREQVHAETAEIKERLLREQKEKELLLRQ